MGTDVLTNFMSIEEELERAKNNLKGLNENIRRIIGRDLSDIQLRGDRKRSFNNEQRRNDRVVHISVEKNRNREQSPPAKRRTSMPETKSVFSRLSGPPSHLGGGGGGNIIDDEPKPKITSRIIKELPTRQEIVAAQGSDAASRARNKRMFGSLLGTLQKFCQEESRLKPKEEKKAQIEKKLEDQQKKERENLRKERQDLFTNRKKQQMEIKMLETKITRMKELSIWEEAKKPLMNFAQTKAKPRIYYLPKILNKKVEKKLADNKTEIEKAIIKKRNETEEELATIANRFKVSETGSLDAGQLQEKYEELSLTKHDRRNIHGGGSSGAGGGGGGSGGIDDDDDNDDYNIYNNLDEPNDICSSAPDISIVKQEVTSVDITKMHDSEDKVESSPNNRIDGIKMEEDPVTFSISTTTSTVTSSTLTSLASSVAVIE